MGSANAKFRADGKGVDYLQAAFEDSAKTQAIIDKLNEHPELKSKVEEVLGDLDLSDVMDSCDRIATLKEHVSADRLEQLATLLQENESN